MFTIATYNVNSVRKRLPIVLAWLSTHQPDVLCLQETKVQDSEFPVGAFAGTSYHLAFRGMKGYHGVALLSRHPPEQVSFGLDDGAEADAFRLIRSKVQGITIVNTYVPQGMAITSPKYAYKLEWFKRLRAYLERHASPREPLIWIGDMNVAPESIDVHHPEDHANHVCFHRDARAAYQAVVSWGLEDVFRRLHPKKCQYTFWDFRAPSAFQRNLGWRIDHILATPTLAAKCAAAEVDVEPRRHPEPSDHTLLWASFHF